MLTDDMPPPSRNHLVPTAGDTPATAAASSVDTPRAIAAQNRCRSSRRATGGGPATAGPAYQSPALPSLSDVPSQHLEFEVLRRLVESALPGPTRVRELRARRRRAVRGVGRADRRRAAAAAPPASLTRTKRTSGQQGTNDETPGSPLVASRRPPQRIRSLPGSRWPASRCEPLPRAALLEPIAAEPWDGEGRFRVASVGPAPNDNRRGRLLNHIFPLAFSLE